MRKQCPDIFVTGAALGLLLLIAATGVHAQEPIQHDAEHYMLLAQHGERWAQEDKAVAAKLEEVRNTNPEHQFFCPGKPDVLSHVL